MEPTRRVDEVAPGMAFAGQPLPDVATAGQPTEDDLRRLAEAGWRTVLDLRRPGEERGYDEAAAARAAGMEYVNVPVAGEVPDESFDAVRALLADDGRRPVLFHCASANRVGALLIPFLVLDRGVGEDEALETAARVGLRSEALARQALDYVGRRRGGETT